MKTRYKIVRMFRDGHPSKVIRRGLTLKQAQRHCSDKETSSSTCTTAEGKALTETCGPWFDGFEIES